MMNAMPREWSLRSVSESLLGEVWRKLPHHKGSPWSGDLGEDFATFVRVHSRCPVILMFPFGMVRVDAYASRGTALCHALVWSHEAYGKREMAREGMDALCATLGVLTLSMMVPKGSRSLERLATFSGLVYIGEGDGVGGPRLWLYTPRRSE